MPASPRWRIFGVDFTSRPRPGKAITVACGFLESDGFRLDAIDEISDWPRFEAWLRTPGPWIGGFDFPFGLPREAVADLRWPLDYTSLVRHCAALGREGFRDALDRYREGRALGNRYAHRAADLPARAHSPLKLVNPPVGLMFLEGVPRLLDAGVTMPGLHAGDPKRIALEAYPGYAARSLGIRTYKNDAVAMQTPARKRARSVMVKHLAEGTGSFDFPLITTSALRNSLVSDASGDRLDAALCALQAAWAQQRRKRNYGLPASIDPVEGWIVTVAPPQE